MITIDNNLNFFKSMKIKSLFKFLQKNIEESMKRSFSVEHLRQILNIVPEFYIHRWIQFQGEQQLMIGIPRNLDLILSRIFEKSSNGVEKLQIDQTKWDYFSEPMGDDIRKLRIQIFKKRLFNSVELQHMEFLANLFSETQDEAIKNEIIEYKTLENPNAWYHQFDVGLCAIIDKANLKPKPS